MVATVGLSSSVIIAAAVWLTVAVARGGVSASDRLASVISAYIGICGLVATVTGTLIRTRQDRSATKQDSSAHLALPGPRSSVSTARIRGADRGDHADDVSVLPAVPVLVESHDITRVGSASEQVPEAQQRHRRADPVPRELPGAPRLFTGRVRELALLTAALDTGAEEGATLVISALGGVGGIGKTTLALRWAHENVERFPDGQLYVNLRGFDPTEAPMSSGVAIRGFLDALRVNPSAIPVDLNSQTALYRGLVAGKRMLIVLDNARDTAHVAPLLPGGSTCTVLVTSRNQLAGLITAHGARPLALDTLTEAESREMLTRHIGPDCIAAEPKAVNDLLEQCAGLPLALGIIAARVVTHPGFPLSVLADELRDTATRLDAFDAGELNVNLRAVFSSSCDGLDTETANMFGLLGLAPGPDISLHAVANLNALSVSHARALLRDLEVAQLVQQYHPGRYRMHDLVRLYAAERASHNHSDGGRYTALRRVVDFYLHTAYAGERLLYPHRRPIKLDPPTSAWISYPIKNPEAALTWFDTEHPCLLAAQQMAVEQGWNTHVWQLAWSLSSFHWRQGRIANDSATVWRAALIAADRLGVPATQAKAHRHLGRACTWATKHTESFEHLQHALTLSEEADDAPEQAATHRTLAWAWEQQGDYKQALSRRNQITYPIG